MRLGSDGQFAPNGMLSLHWPSGEADPAMGRIRATTTNLEAAYAVSPKPTLYSLEGTDILSASVPVGIDYSSAKGRKDVVGARLSETFVLVPEAQVLSEPQYPLPAVISASFIYAQGNSFEASEGEVAPLVKLPKNLEAIDSWLPTLLESSRDGAELMDAFVVRCLELFVAGHQSPEVAFEALYGEKGQLLQREIREALERLRDSGNESYGTRERNVILGALNLGPAFSLERAIQAAKSTLEAQKVDGYQSPLEVEMGAKYARLARQIAERKSEQRVVAGESATNPKVASISWRPSIRTSAIALAALAAFAATNPTVERFAQGFGFNANRGGDAVQQNRQAGSRRAQPLRPATAQAPIEDRILAELTTVYEAEERARLALEAYPLHPMEGQYSDVETTSFVAERVRGLRPGGEIVIDGARYIMDADGFLRSSSEPDRAD